MDNDLYRTVVSGGLILTANKRLARQLVQQYDQRQITVGETVWPSPPIMSLDAWMMRRLQELDSATGLLTDVQSLRLWEEVIQADAGAVDRDLLQVPQAARRALEAHRLLSSYPTAIPIAEADEDHLAFMRWRKHWQERLRRGAWLDRAEVLTAVTTAIGAGRCEVPSTVVLAGFDDLTPALLQFCAVLEGRGGQIVYWEPPAVSDARVGVHAAIDMADEVRSCARWVRLKLEREPQARIGIVAPRLGEYQGLIERIFRAELDPSSCLRVEDGPESFTFSLGRPLIEEGPVRAAMRLLGAGDPLRLEDAGWLLRSPYLGGARSEGLGRAAADRLLRERGRHEWRLPALARALSGVPRMAAIFARLQDAGGDRRRLPGEWSEYFAGLLESCGWPGDRGLNSREFQAIDHLRGVLEQLATLDRVAQKMSRSEALAILQRLVRETVFQTEGPEGRVQVLGMLEAAGFSFEALWVLGLHEGAFPAPSRPNPFLPLTVQSRMCMPHADASREREFAGRLAGRLFSSSAEVVASWPSQLDGAPLRPSPLLKGLPAVDPELAASCDPFCTLAAAPCTFETVADDRAAPLPSDRPFAGGTNILKDQALCPFRAFAHHRLHAEGLDAPDLGLDTRARGNLVHGVLERFWRQIVSHEALRKLAAQRQAELLAAAAEDALQQHERRSRCDLPLRLRALEGRRLVAMAAVWLELERHRAPFRVAEVEQRHDAVVGGLRLRTRIDRIDQLSNGQLAVIDYKTGRPSPRQWLDLRVTEPQLPLYCLDLDRDRIGAVLFAMVRSREKECAFKGVAREPDVWPKMSARSQDKLLMKSSLSSFDEILAHWRKTLPELGRDFVAGIATVDPVDPQQACNYCDLAIFCRIGSQADKCDDHDEGESDG